MLEFKDKSLHSELETVRENYESLRKEYEDLKSEHTHTKMTNIEYEKENHALQYNVDKVTRALNKVSAESVRYKSVVDLQKNAL